MPVASVAVVRQKEGECQGSRGEENEVPKPAFLLRAVRKNVTDELGFRNLLITALSLPIQPLLPAISSSSLSRGQLIVFGGVTVETVE